MATFSGLQRFDESIETLGDGPPVIRALPPRVSGDRLEVALDGQMCHETVSQVAAPLMSLAGRDGVARLHVDLDCVDFMDVGGIDLMAELAARCATLGSQLTLGRANASVSRLLGTCGMADLLERQR